MASSISTMFMLFMFIIIIRENNIMITGNKLLTPYQGESRGSILSEIHTLVCHWNAVPWRPKRTRGQIGVARGSMEEVRPSR